MAPTENGYMAKGRPSKDGLLSHSFTMGEAARVYAEQLQRYGYGHALWWPEHIEGPDGCKREIDIGDVGYIDRDGAFHPLFNITYPADDERNAGGLPTDDFVPLRYSSRAVETKQNFLPAGPLQSHSVTSRRISAGLALSGEVIKPAKVELSYSFECSESEGAFLLLWDGATKRVVDKSSHDFERYMLQNHDAWCEYARNKLGLSYKNEDIVLVRGFIKASRWTISTFLGSRSHTQEVTVSGKLASIVDVEISHSSHEDVRCSPISPRSGPLERIRVIADTPLSSGLSGEDKSHPFPQDQCIFLNYYKVKRRWYLGPREIKAAAGPDESGDSRGRNDHSELEISLDMGSAIQDFCNPLDTILDYILEVSDAEVALASHNDLQDLNLNDSRQTLEDRLRLSPPRVVVLDKVGRLQCGQNSAKGTKLEIDASASTRLTSVPSPQHTVGIRSVSYSSARSPPLSSSPQFHTFAHADYAYAANCGHGILVPQQVYQPPARYDPLPAIRFSTRGVPGVRLVDALPGVIQSLEGRESIPQLSSMGKKITLRILWPGYPSWDHGNIAIKHFNTKANGYTMEELAGTIANHVRKFYQDRQPTPCNAPDWQLQRYPFEKLYLLELRHVGQDSWQPVLTVGV